MREVTMSMIMGLLSVSLLFSLAFNVANYYLSKAYEETIESLVKQNNTNFERALELIDIITSKQKEDANTNND